MQNETETKMPDREQNTLPSKIVFFDGVCALCNGTVNFLMDRDTGQSLTFAPLQGETAQQALSESDRDLTSIVFVDDQGTWKHSTAIVRILSNLPQPWRTLGGCLWFIPRPLRDLAYRVVGASRYKVFGKHETCRMPTEKDRNRLLD